MREAIDAKDTGGIELQILGRWTVKQRIWSRLRFALAVQ